VTTTYRAILALITVAEGQADATHVKRTPVPNFGDIPKPCFIDDDSTRSDSVVAGITTTCNTWAFNETDVNTRRCRARSSRVRGTKLPGLPIPLGRRRTTPSASRYAVLTAGGNPTGLVVPPRTQACNRVLTVTPFHTADDRGRAGVDHLGIPLQTFRTYRQRKL